MRRLLLLAALAGLCGCMEVEQANSPERKAGQTVKRDVPAWDNEPLANGPKWIKGDRTSWEEQIKKRQLSQNESRRISQ
jgi:hypothetical protein